jgi:hypothetical protein
MSPPGSTVLLAGLRFPLELGLGLGLRLGLWLGLGLGLGLPAEAGRRLSVVSGSEG